MQLASEPWASEGFLQGGARGDFFILFLQGRKKGLNLFFSHSKLRKQPFFAEIFKIQGPPAIPFRRPCS